MVGFPLHSTTVPCSFLWSAFNPCLPSGLPPACRSSHLRPLSPNYAYRPLSHLARLRVAFTPHHIAYESSRAYFPPRSRCGGLFFGCLPSYGLELDAPLPTPVSVRFVSLSRPLPLFVSSKWWCASLLQLPPCAAHALPLSLRFSWPSHGAP